MQTWLPSTSTKSMSSRMRRSSANVAGPLTPAGKCEGCRYTRWCEGNSFTRMGKWWASRGTAEWQARCEENFEIGRRLISDPKSEILNWTASATSNSKFRNFGSEMRDLSDFQIYL